MFFVPSWFDGFGLLIGDGWGTEFPVGDGNCPAGLIREAIEEVCGKPGVVLCVINDELIEWQQFPEQPRVGEHDGATDGTSGMCPFPVENRGRI